ncbi:protein trichome birefringence-like 19 [Salvia splendens]|uniref:protein trichome birefringence-like 19 n=1 Tax=Salvia splendens TaxID=180675 RepID=UPI001C2795E1|nr:protein trichome birefringence-like 19 [Salvia splendens]
MNPYGKSQTRKKTRKAAPIAALALLLTIPLYLSFTGDSSSSHQTFPSRAELHQCDLFSGEWVPNPDGPYYTNETCNAIQEHQNCMRFGRPDTGYLKWRWKPDACELPLFQPDRFLKLVRGKSLAFVGDSVARNHMQSLLCLLSKVAHPIEWSDPLGKQIQYHYKEHDFNISIFWTPFLVKTGILDPSLGRPFDLYLDEFDDTWSNQIAQFHYVIISAGHWFFRPSYFHLQRRLHGCLYCPEPDSNITHLTPAFAHRWAFRTAFRAINGAAGYKGVTFVRTFAPSHFEGGAWDKGGNCLRTKPFTRNETSLDEKALEFYTIQLEELGIARTQNRGRRFVLFDTTKPMVLRPDGHPSIYGHLPGAKLVMSNDCVHWCLPGPIDAWSDFLQELLRREVVGN